MNIYSVLRIIACTIAVFLAPQLPTWAHTDEEFVNQHLFENVKGTRLYIGINGRQENRDFIYRSIADAWNAAFHDSGVTAKYWIDEAQPQEIPEKNILYVYIVVGVKQTENCEILAAIGVDIEKEFRREAVVSLPVVPVCTPKSGTDIYDVAYRLIRWNIASAINRFN